MIAEHTERAATKALRKWRRGAVLAVVLMLASNGYALYSTASDSVTGRKAIVQSGRYISVDGCNRDFVSLTKLRGVLQQARFVVTTNYKRGLYPKSQYKQSLQFYDSQLAELTLPDCRDARRVVTDDPRKIGPIPTPRYPGDPKSRIDQMRQIQNQKNG